MLKRETNLGVAMTTALDKALRREITINERTYTLTIDPSGMKLVEKGRRNGIGKTWRELLVDDSAAGHATVTPSGA